MNRDRELQKVVVAVHGPVGDGAPAAAGLTACAVLRPHPHEPSPHPEGIGGVVLAWLDAAARPDPTTWFDVPVAAYRVDERVPLDRLLGRPGDAPSSAIVQCSFVRRLPHRTREAFAAHWRTVHAPLVPIHHPGVARYVQNVVVEPLTPNAAEVDGIAQLYFPTAHDFHERYYDSEAGRQLVGDDVARFIDRPRGWRIHAQETWILR